MRCSRDQLRGWTSYQSRMTGIFKSRWQKIRELMKHLGLVPIFPLLVVGLFTGLAMAELTAYQQVPSQASVGETVMVSVMLTYNGASATQAVVTPSLPSGVVSDAGEQTAELSPGAQQRVSYPIRAEQSGTYWIVSQIAYAEDGTWRNLRLEAPFTAIGMATTEPQTWPGQTFPSIGTPSGDTPNNPGPIIGNPGGNPGDSEPSEVAMPRNSSPGGEGDFLSDNGISHSSAQKGRPRSSL
ncbi:Uncharacterised protein [uncultured archaeon]|nr:Uncharacterised protein [uncultured archaeon]